MLSALLEGGSIAPPAAGAAEIGAGTVCLYCGLDWKFNKPDRHPLSAVSEDDSGWGIGDSPAGIAYCDGCKSRTPWGMRPDNGLPLPGEPPRPDLQGVCTHLDTAGVPTMAYFPTSWRKKEIHLEDGKEVEYLRDIPGKAQYECRVCGKHYHGKRNRAKRKGWVVDMENPVEVPSLGSLMAKTTEVIEDTMLELMEQPMNDILGDIEPQRERYELPDGAFNLVECDGECLYEMLHADYSVTTEIAPRKLSREELMARIAELEADADLQP